MQRRDEEVGGKRGRTIGETLNTIRALGSPGLHDGGKGPGLIRKLFRRCETEVSRAGDKAENQEPLEL